MVEDSRTEFDRMYSILGGLLFDINLVNIYMSREDYPKDLLSRNEIVVDIVSFIKDVWQEENITITWNRFKDLLSRKLNKPIEALDDYQEAEPYYVIWEKAESQYIKESQSEEYVSKWKAELKWLVEFYVERKTKWITKQQYLMLKQQCFGSPCENPCAVKNECRKCLRHGTKKLDHILSWYEEEIIKVKGIMEESRGMRAISYRDNLDNRIEMYRREHEYRLSGNKTLGVPTGINALDEQIDGLRKAQTIGIFGRSGVGKSALALQISLDAWVNSNTNILFLNLELPIDEIQKRMDSALTAVPFGKIYTGKWDSTQERENFITKIEVLREEKQNEFVILDVFDLTVGSLHSIIKQYYEKWGDNFIVVLDNINRMSLPAGVAEHLSLKNIGICFHKYMKEFNCSGVLVGQLNRDGKNVKRVGQADGNVIAGADAIVNDLSAAFMIQKYLGNEMIRMIPLKGRNFDMENMITLKNNLWKMRMEEVKQEGNVYDPDASEFLLEDEGDLNF